MRKAGVLTILVCLLVTVHIVSADTIRGMNIDFVTIDNAGNQADPSTGVGAVDHDYRIGTYEITTGQYVHFLNDAAQSNSYGLYNTKMSTSSWGCKVTQSGSSGSYSYSVPSDRANRPVNFISWYDALRFCNWLTSGNTEQGVYNTTTWTSDRAAAQAAWGTIYFLPTRDEWYKAAYHKNDGPTDHYWLYPTQSNDTPGNDLLSPDPGNSANYYQAGYTLGSPYWTTEVGAFTNSAGPYGTFDQGGNILEWNETITMFGEAYNDIYGGAYYTSALTLSTDYWIDFYPDFEGDGNGLRIASIVPEPATLLLLGLGGMLIRKR